MSSRELGIFGLFSYREFKYNDFYFGTEKNNSDNVLDLQLKKSFVIGQKIFKSLESIDVNDFIHNYKDFLTFLNINKFNVLDFVSYLLPRNIETCYSRCFSRKINNGNFYNKDIHVIYKHLVTLMISNIEILNNDILLTLKSRVCDDNFKLYVRNQSNHLEILDDLVMFYEIQQKANDDVNIELNNIKKMIDSSEIKFLYLHETEKLFPKENEKLIIKKISYLSNNVVHNNSIQYLPNVEYILNFPIPMNRISSKSFYVWSCDVLWNIAYERKVKKHLILNINEVKLIDTVKKSTYPFLISDIAETTDSEFIKKINKCVEKIHDIIFLLQHDFDNLVI